MNAGFKNGTDGSVSVAVDAMRSASNPHAFMGVTPSGLASIVKTRGNTDLHVILRGGTNGTNYDAESVKRVRAKLRKDRPAARPSIMIDASREFRLFNFLQFSTCYGWFLIEIDFGHWPCCIQMVILSKTTITSQKLSKRSMHSSVPGIHPSLGS